MEENKEKVQEIVPPQNIERAEFQLNEQSPTLGKLAKSLAKFQTELAPASMDSKNPFFNSKYSDISEVLKACQSLLGKNGIALTQGSTTCKRTGLFSVWSQLTHESGEYIRTGVAVSLGKKDNHAIGSALTYGRRYSLAAIVGISQQDDDANRTVKNPQTNGVTKTNGRVTQ
jgi:hypothetical protein